MKKAIKNEKWEEVHKRLETGQKLYEIIQ
jgi:hypothetical protein